MAAEMCKNLPIDRNMVVGVMTKLIGVHKDKVAKEEKAQFEKLNQEYLENLYASDGHDDLENATEDDIQPLDPTTADGTGKNTMTLQQQLQLETDFTKEENVLNYLRKKENRRRLLTQGWSIDNIALLLRARSEAVSMYKRNQQRKTHHSGSNSQHQNVPRASKSLTELLVERWCALKPGQININPLNLILTIRKVKEFQQLLILEQENTIRLKELETNEGSDHLPRELRSLRNSRSSSFGQDNLVTIGAQVGSRKEDGKCKGSGRKIPVLVRTPLLEDERLLQGSHGHPLPPEVNTFLNNLIDYNVSVAHQSQEELESVCDEHMEFEDDDLSLELHQDLIMEDETAIKLKEKELRERVAMNTSITNIYNSILETTNNITNNITQTTTNSVIVTTNINNSDTLNINNSDTLNISNNSAAINISSMIADNTNISGMISDASNISQSITDGANIIYTTTTTGNFTDSNNITYSIIDTTAPNFNNTIQNTGHNINDTSMINNSITTQNFGMPIGDHSVINTVSEVVTSNMAFSEATNNTTSAIGEPMKGCDNVTNIPVDTKSANDEAKIDDKVGDDENVGNDDEDYEEDLIEGVYECSVCPASFHNYNNYQLHRSLHVSLPIHRPPPARGPPTAGPRNLPLVWLGYKDPKGRPYYDYAFYTCAEIVDELVDRLDIL
eukprot:TRINITY_DN8435_c0_g1_i8.p1 TRINITY_DN8435_c0_g1~~TRINITY_DN8435_c0_g1_i8.p1  ORF type:complete len:720 (-),score=222.17 TRINITY_DN8435_c0_g1_i8:792-2810(-)